MNYGKEKELVIENESFEEKPKKRRKHVHPPALKSCANCKKSHTRCSNNRPCERCLRKGIECFDVPINNTPKFIITGLFHSFHLDKPNSQPSIAETSTTKTSEQNSDQEDTIIQQPQTQEHTQYGRILDFITHRYEERTLHPPPKTSFDKMSLKMIAAMSYPIAICDKNSLDKLYCNFAHEKLFHNAILNPTEERIFDYRYKGISMLDMVFPLARHSVLSFKSVNKMAKIRISYIKLRSIMLDCHGRLVVGTDTIHMEEDFCWTEFKPEGVLIPKNDNTTQYYFKPLARPNEQLHTFLFDDAFEIDGVAFPSSISGPDISVLHNRLARAADFISKGQR